jgi:hypothetical protein
MAHKIEQPYDQVYSTVSREWHGLAELVETINEETLSPILFPIIEGDITISIDGESVKMTDKAIVADYRHRDDIPQGERIRGLSTMGKDYCVIDNRSIFNCVQQAINQNGLDAEIVTAGTVRSGKSFFISLQQSDASKEVLKGDNWDFYLNLTTSHDGIDALLAYVCGFRTVCWNTLRAGVDSSDSKVSIYHKKNAALQMDSLPEILLAMRNQQTEMIEALCHLAGITCSVEKAERIVSGYFSQLQDGNTEFSGRSSKAVNEIVTTFQRGMGNRGETMYDLLNGVTEYYTSGQGTGQKSNLADRAFKANFGSAADHKERFTNLLFDKNSRQELEELGSRVVLKALKD